MTPTDIIFYGFIYAALKNIVGFLLVVFLVNYTLAKIYFINPSILPPVIRKEVKKWVD